MTKPQESQLLARRKSDHLELALRSQVALNEQAGPFDYEPLFGTHQLPAPVAFNFLGKEMRLPLWVSSMTGGSQEAGQINRCLARAVSKYGLGMGLGSCRSLLESDEFFSDFDLRAELGMSAPFFANIGIAQLEELQQRGETRLLAQMMDALKADGLIVHLNPLQEWFQPEGDRYQVAPIETLRQFLPTLSLPLIVKEVGQGMGPRSLEALCELGVAGIELAALGGTNFTKLERLRRHDIPSEWEDFVSVGHGAPEMLTNLINISRRYKLPALILSGGIRSCLQGHELLLRAPQNSVLGLATPFLEQAKKGESELFRFVENWATGLSMARAFLAPREENR